MRKKREKKGKAYMQHKVIEMKFETKYVMTLSNNNQGRVKSADHVKPKQMLIHILLRTTQASLIPYHYNRKRKKINHLYIKVPYTPTLP